MERGTDPGEGGDQHPSPYQEIAALRLRRTACVSFSFSFSFSFSSSAFVAPSP